MNGGSAQSSRGFLGRINLLACIRALIVLKLIANVLVAVSAGAVLEAQRHVKLNAPYKLFLAVYCVLNIAETISLYFRNRIFFQIHCIKDYHEKDVSMKYRALDVVMILWCVIGYQWAGDDGKCKERSSLLYYTSIYCIMFELFSFCALPVIAAMVLLFWLVQYWISDFRRWLQERQIRHALQRQRECEQRQREQEQRQEQHKREQLELQKQQRRLLWRHLPQEERELQRRQEQLQQELQREQRDQKHQQRLLQQHQRQLLWREQWERRWQQGERQRQRNQRRQQWRQLSPEGLRQWHREQERQRQQEMLQQRQRELLWRHLPQEEQEQQRRQQVLQQQEQRQQQQNQRRQQRQLIRQQQRQELWEQQQREMRQRQEQWWLQHLTVITYLSEDDIPDGSCMCSICSDGYIPGEGVVLLPCNHNFHTGCICMWLRVQKSCPLCRKRIVLDASP